MSFISLLWQQEAFIDLLFGVGLYISMWAMMLICGGRDSNSGENVGNVLS